jgi:hypothetical protein
MGCWRELGLAPWCSAPSIRSSRPGLRGTLRPSPDRTRGGPVPGAFFEPAPRARRDVRGRSAHEPDAVRLSDDSHHGRGHRRHVEGGSAQVAHGRAHPHVRRRARDPVRAARRDRGRLRSALRRREREPLGPSRHRQPARPVRSGHARRVPGTGAAPAPRVRFAHRRRLLRVGVPDGGHVGRGRRALRGARVRRRAHLGGGDAGRSHGLRLPLRLLARDDRAPRGGGTFFGHADAASALRSVDGVGQADRRGDSVDT